jgi:hypothetical protein
MMAHLGELRGEEDDGEGAVGQRHHAARSRRRGQITVPGHRNEEERAQEGTQYGTDTPVRVHAGFWQGLRCTRAIDRLKKAAIAQRRISSRQMGSTETHPTPVPVMMEKYTPSMSVHPSRAEKTRPTPMQ